MNNENMFWILGIYWIPTLIFLMAWSIRIRIFLRKCGTKLDELGQLGEGIIYALWAVFGFIMLFIIWKSPIRWLKEPFLPYDQLNASDFTKEKNNGCFYD